MSKIRIAVQGCCHGELDSIFKKVQQIHSRKALDLLIILGDFQSIRDRKDMDSISVPPKYRKMGKFYKYYRNDIYKIPVPVLFIGGNHESMRHLMQLPYGGYVSPNIYYLGYSNVVWFKGVRIGSISGIYKEWDFDTIRPSWDKMEAQQWDNSIEYSNINIKSLYHVRRKDVIPLYMMNNKKQMDIMLSHDWPDEVAYHGNIEELLRIKPFFRKDINNHELGSPIDWELLCRFKPKWWLSAHLHVRYKASIQHATKDSSEKVSDMNKDEINLDLSDDDENIETNKNNVELMEDDKPQTTEFLALDKCMPGRKWMDVIEVEPNEDHISYQDMSHNESLNLYWDKEFVRNLELVQERKDLLNVPLNNITYENLFGKSLGPFDETSPDNANESVYKVPKYTKGLQRRECEQTEYFEKTFLTR